jgi:hypothetical protein
MPEASEEGQKTWITVSGVLGKVTTVVEDAKGTVSEYLISCNIGPIAAAGSVILISKRPSAPLTASVACGGGA